jgi:Flp pilus assembly protein TadG
MERMRKMKRGKGSRERLRGAMLAEAALVMMVLMLVTLGALQYGWFFYCLHSVTNAARQGARVESTLDGDGLGDTALLDTLKKALPSELWGSATHSVSLAGQNVTAQVSIPAGTVALMPITFLPVPDCRATVVMAKEGAS